MNTGEGAFGLWISILGRAARSYFQKALKPWNLGPGQQAYLLALDPAEKEVQQDELVRRLSVDKANVTRAVTALEEKGYLARRRSDKDRREWRISLTAEGSLARKQVEEISRTWLRYLRTAVTEEEWSCAESALQKIAHHAVVYMETEGETIPQ